MSRNKLQTDPGYDYHLDPTVTQRAIEVARRLFLDGHLYETVTDQGVGRYVMFQPKRFEAIMGLLSDSGMIYLSYPEAIAGTWEEIFEYVELGLPNWILQNATLWRIQTFSSSDEYLIYLHHLSMAYGQHTVPPLENRRVTDNEAMIALDNDHYNRLPIFKDYIEMLYSNPWFVFLLTVHCSYPEIYRNLQQFYTTIAASINPGTEE